MLCPLWVATSTFQRNTCIKTSLTAQLYLLSKRKGRGNIQSCSYYVLTSRASGCHNWPTFRSSTCSENHITLSSPPYQGGGNLNEMNLPLIRGIEGVAVNFLWESYSSVTYISTIGSFTFIIRP